MIKVVVIIIIIITIIIITILLLCFNSCFVNTLFYNSWMKLILKSLRLKVKSVVKPNKPMLSIQLQCRLTEVI